MLISIVSQRFSRDWPMFVCVFAKKFPALASCTIMLWSLSSQGRWGIRISSITLNRIQGKGKNKSRSCRNFMCAYHSRRHRRSHNRTRLLKNLWMSIHSIKWYNDVIFVVSDACIVCSKKRSALVELEKPFLRPIRSTKEWCRGKTGSFDAEDTSPMAPPTTMWTWLCKVWIFGKR